MANTGAIRAGRAYVELFADDKPLEKGLQSGQQSLAKYSSQVAQVQKRLKAAETGGSQVGQLTGVLRVRIAEARITPA